jgi:hypothetical protein
MWPSLLAGLALLASQAQALYFYIDGPSQKCFFEEPKGHAGRWYVNG